MASEGSTKKVILAAALLVTAGVIYFVMNGSDDGAAALAGDKSLWFCTSCQKSFELTPAQAQTDVHAELRSTGDASTDEPQARGRGDRVMFNVAKCPSCGQWKGEAARKCPDCGEVFIARTSKGETAICPKCKWDPSTGRKAEGDRLELEP